jgi:protein KTI12
MPICALPANSVETPATQQDYLYELDKGTTEIVSQILSWQKDHEGESGGRVSIPGVESQIQLPTATLSLPQLHRMRRQFISLNRQHSLDKSRIQILFVDFLNDAFGPK